MKSQGGEQTDDSLGCQLGRFRKRMVLGKRCVRPYVKSASGL